MIKAVIFDMDGVLIEAKDWHYESLNRALNLFGYHIDRYEHLTSFDGLPTKVKLERLSVEKDLPRELHQFINELKQKYTMEIIYSQCKPMFNHEYALSKLKSQGYKLGVASNSIRQTIDIMMERSCLLPYLDSIMSNEDVSKAKPDPEIYSRSMQRLKFSPSECLVVEDNENGIKAAKDSGAHVLVVKEVTDVTYENIMNRIQEINSMESR